MSRAEIETRAAKRLAHLTAKGAHVHLPRDDLAYGIETGLRMLTLRRIVQKGPAGYAVVEDQRQILSYYANTIEHLLTEDAAAPVAT